MRMESLPEISCVVHSPVSLSVSTCSDGRSFYDGRTTTTVGSSSTTSDHYQAHQTPVHSGCQVMDVELHQPCSQISIIRFRNHYTYAITVLYHSSVVPEPRVSTQEHTNMFESCSSEHGARMEWKVGVAKHILMLSCHCDSPDAQKWVELGESDFQGKLEGVVRFILILRQPSPHWREFCIENFSCYHHDSSTHLSMVSRDHGGCGPAGTGWRGF